MKLIETIGMNANSNYNSKLVAEKCCFLYGLVSNREVFMAVTAALAYLAAFGAIDLDGS